MLIDALKNFSHPTQVLDSKENLAKLKKHVKIQ